ncbi:MAG: alpha-glucan family phosphorylase [Anaerolineaceae bacterium]|nr:alpha-glucan family phosphorylase [Anaerolineaceae bacterium]MBN2676888.1 alpha-glucan family phosphorylase [Anaerolineaceae bacterium]
MDNNIARAEIPNHFDLPRRISGLAELVYNLWWAWNPEVQRLFAETDKNLWEQVYHNPVMFLRRVDRAHLNAVISQKHLLTMYDNLIQAFLDYNQSTDTWFTRTYPAQKDQAIAYFSFEYGLHEALPVYAGGLGVLSGDHLKEASDLGLPLVAVGFLYSKGYFSQHITEDGWQEAHDYTIDYNDVPLVPLLDQSGEPFTIKVELPGREVSARVWQVNVGRVKLLLLDSKLPDNAQVDQQLTERLYGSDLELRISQEILLGIGGVKLLHALDIHVTVWHMNEGHSAFLQIERLKNYLENGMTLAEAQEEVKRSSIFTTHTPVPAGNDEFPLWLIDKYFANTWTQIGCTREEFIDFGKTTTGWGGEAFSMPVLAFKLSQRHNAVSELHMQVSRKMWAPLWPGKKIEEIPIGHVTNGVHVGSWLARRMQALYQEHLDPDWLERSDDPAMWERVLSIPDKELWIVRRHLKRKLTSYVGERIRRQWMAGNLASIQVVAGGVLLDPYILTIGFARRFATYKRANLILSDFERLLRLLNTANAPLQIIFAGKAHPADEPGKLLIQELYRAVKNARGGGRLVFLEDYDMNIARYLVQGVDIWLNTPRRPLEASGTSGQKAAMNGVLNFSVLDGWWREGYNGNNGWAIGVDTNVTDPHEQDTQDASDLYNTLENDIIPMYYENRSSENIPTQWIARMKESIRTLTPLFNTRRMLKEYIGDYYLPAMKKK